MKYRSAGLAVGTALVAAAGLLGAIPHASASTLAGYTWSGADGSTNRNWSDANNWQGGFGPASGSTASLSFPSAACTTTSCPGPSSTNDLTGLTVPTLSVSLIGGAPTGWFLGGNAITIDNLAASTDTTAGSTVHGSTLALPLQLDGNASSLTWNASISSGANLNLAGGVTGTPALTVDLPSTASGFAGFLGTPIFNTGALTFRGSSTGSNAVIVAGKTLNGTTRKPVKFVDSNLFVPGNSRSSLAAATTTYGPLTIDATSVQLGNGGGRGPYGFEKVKGGLILDSRSRLTYFSLEPGVSNRPGLDYPQIAAAGKATIAAGLTLFAPCAAQTVGTVYTILTAGKGLSGTFAGVPNGTVVAPIGDNTCASGTQPGYGFQIDYNTSTLPASVTATVVALTTAAAGSSRPGHVWQS